MYIHFYPPFIDAALRYGATIAIFAHTRPYSALYPTEADMATVKMLARELGGIGVRIAEHYVVSGTRYIGISERMHIRLASDTPQLMRFLDSKKGVEN